MLRLLVLSILIIATFVTHAQAFGENYRAASLSDQEKAAIEESIRSEMRDPASALFYDLVGASDGVVKAACGWVNGKNGFGGFTGKQPFWVMQIGTVWLPMGIGGSRNEMATTMSMCADMAMPLR